MVLGNANACAPHPPLQAGGGRGARWYRSIVVYDARMTLGRWLTANGLGVRMGPQRPRGRKRPAEGAPGGVVVGGEGGGGANDSEGSDDSGSDNEDVGASGGAVVGHGAVGMGAEQKGTELAVRARKRLAAAGCRREGTEGGAEVDPGLQSGPLGLPKATDIAALLLAALPPATVAAAAAAVVAAVAEAAANGGVGNTVAGAAAVGPPAAAAAAHARGGAGPRRMTNGGSAQPEGQLQEGATVGDSQAVSAARQHLKRRASAPMPPLMRPAPPLPADIGFRTAPSVQALQGEAAMPSPLVRPWGSGQEFAGRAPHSLVLPPVSAVASDASGSGGGAMGLRGSRRRRATEGGAGEGGTAAAAAVGGPGVGRLTPSEAPWVRGGRAVGAMDQATAAAGCAAAAAGSDAVGGAENGAAAGSSWRGLAADGSDDRGRAILRARPLPLLSQHEQQQQQPQRPPHVPEQRGAGSRSWVPAHGFALPPGRSVTLAPLPPTPFTARPGPAHGPRTPPAHVTEAEAPSAGPPAAAMPAAQAKGIPSLQWRPSHLELCEPHGCEAQSPSSPTDRVLLPTRGSGPSGVVRALSDPQHLWSDPRVSPPASHSPREQVTPSSPSPRTDPPARHSRTAQAWPYSPTDRCWRPEHYPTYHHPGSHGMRMYRPTQQYGTWPGAGTIGAYPGATPPPATRYASVVHMPEPQPYHAAVAAAPPASSWPPPAPWRRPLQGAPPAPRQVVQVYPAVQSYGTCPDAEYRYHGQEQVARRERAGASGGARGEVEGAAAAEAPGPLPVGHVAPRTVTTGNVIMPLRITKQHEQEQQESGSEGGCEDWARPLSRRAWEGAAGPYARSSDVRHERWVGREAPKEQRRAGGAPVMLVLQPGRQAARGSSDASGRPRARPPAAPPRSAAAPHVVLYQPLPAVRSSFIVQSGAAGHVVHMVGVPAVPVVRDGDWVARPAERAVVGTRGRVRGGVLGVPGDGRSPVRSEAGFRGVEDKDAAIGGVGGGERERCDGVEGAEEGEGAGQRGLTGGLLPRGRWMARWTQQQGQQQQQAEHQGKQQEKQHGSHGAW